MTTADNWPGWAPTERPPTPTMRRRTPDERLTSRRANVTDWCRRQRRSLAPSVDIIRKYPDTMRQESEILAMVEAFESWLVRMTTADGYPEHPRDLVPEEGK